MKPKTLILMLVAVACGLAAAYIAATYQPGARPQEGTVTVLVALTDWPANTMINLPDKMFAPKAYPKDLAPEGAISDPSIIKGKVLQRMIYKNQVINSKDLNQADALDVLCPDGFKMFTFRVNQETGHVGFVLPGSKVDLTCTVSEQGVTQRTWTGVFLRDVLVLAVNTDKGTEARAGAPVPPATITMALQEKDLNRLVAVRDKGAQISILLRKKGQKDTQGEEEGPFLFDTKNVFDGKGIGGKEKASSIEYWVAREDIEAPRTISNPEDLFVLKVIPADFAVNAMKKDDKPIGQLYRFVAKGQPVTKAHFDVRGTIQPAGTGSPVASSGGWGTTVQHGLDPVKYYVDGVPVDSGGPRGTLPPAPSTPGGTEPATPDSSKNR